MSTGEGAGQGVAIAPQAVAGGAGPTANLSVPSSPLLNFDANTLVGHYRAGEFEMMARHAPE